MDASPVAKLGPRFTLLWTASAISGLGDGVTMVAAPLLIASMTSSPLVVSGATFAATLPWLLFSLLSGGLVDRLDRRRVMVVVDWIRAVTIGVLGVAVALHRESVVLLYAVLFLLGTGETLFRAASMSMLPAVVQPDLLERANGRLSAARTVVHDMIAGPLGGLLFAAAAAAPFLLDAGSFVVGALLLSLLPGTYREGQAPGAPAAERASLWSEIATGVRWLLAHRLLRTLAVLIGLLNVTLTAAMSILVLLATERLGLGSVGYGALFTALAAGGLLGALVGERLVRRFTASVTLRVGLVVETLFHLTMALSTSPIAVGAILALFGVHGSLWMIVTMSLLQRLTPAAMLGRVNSAYLFLAAGGTAFGAVLGGVVATHFGLTAPYWIGFVVAAAVTAATWRVFDRRSMAAATSTAADAATATV
ncbi:MFS transporter [Planosporangium flavigriseum]|uniref:MFS transporter n=1 Tax=Planosporangium flavigriseum TaxID=373681 RepID=A0A8J3M443_9ACTN|nr:MFS transporter [Planosporangium flavigriseum]NJC67966.1 MFS transporter [Planosporangium flavigriseum]GIG76575.1 MFS transporter [Planosporangium flavigriseum]